MKKLLLLLSVLITAQLASAQEYCGFDMVHQRMLQSDSTYAQSVRAFTTKWAQSHGSANQSIVNNGYGKEYVIPVVVHVIHTGGSVGSAYNPSDATINAAILYLNQTYAATYASYPDTTSGGVRFPATFVLAKRTETCGSTGGIVRVSGTGLTNYSTNGMNLNNATGASETDVKALSKWSNGDYYNIWVVNKIDGHDGTTAGSFTAGFAYFPGANASVDGTVVLASRMIAGSSTLPHEIGHAFNLHHTFNGDASGASCPTNTSCATQGDEVCDTDPHKRNSSACPANTATNACTGGTWAANQTQRNIMDYSTCRDRFSAGQRTRWLAALTGPRSGLASSLGAIAPPTTTTASATCSTTLNATNLVAAQGANMGPVQIVLNDMSSGSKGFGNDGDLVYVDRTCEQLATVTQGKTYTLSVNTETNRQDVQVYIDYNGNGTFVAGEKVMDHSTALSTNGPETHSVSYTVPTTGVNTCGPIRMRVVADWHTSTHITNGCGQLDYGQAEDVTVYVKKTADTVTMTNAITTGSNPTCATGSVTFTASTSKTLTSPTYQWYRNSAEMSGATSSTYTVSSLAVGTYYVHCKIKYTNLCSVADSSFTNVIALVVNSSSVTPSVAISAAPGTTICTGTSVTFTAVPTNGGTTPSYQWKVNGSNVGTNSTGYTSTTLSNSDAVTCVMTSNATCASPTTGTSNTLNMSVSGSVTPSVVISAAPGTTICTGTSVTFTAVPTNGGSTPAYQWKLNGGNVGTNSTTYTNATLSNSDVVTCVMTSNNACASPTTGTSNGLTMSVSSSVTPAVAISVNTGTTICELESTTFTAVPTNGGTTPSYQWKVNSVNKGTNSTTYTTTGINNNDVVTCVMTSNATCASPTTGTSNSITMSVTAPVTPSVATSANPGNTICSGTSVTFTAVPTNGGTPTYQWKLNGANVGTGGTTYTNATLVHNDVVTCVMTSSLTCVTASTATSSAITMVITTSVVPSVVISANPGITICTGTSVTFTAVPTNGGTTPTYQWKLNGGNVGTGGTTYTNTTLANSDVVTCVMTSNNACASPTTGTSNSLTMSVSGVVTPAVGISANPGTTICSGTSIAFTATPTNGGTTPTYQWKLNGANVGTGGTNYANAALVHNDVVTCVMTSNHPCASTATATSNSLTITVGTNLVPSVAIASTATVICSGTSVTFTATPTNGGVAPTYQWKLNGVNVGINNASFNITSLANADVVSCVMTSNATCVSTATANSNNITMTVTPSVTPLVGVTANPGNVVCAGTSITFTATPVNGGAGPIYQWKLNGVNVGSGATTYTNATLSNNDVVSCEMTSNAVCASPTSVSSSNVLITITPPTTPTVTITANPGTTVCVGSTTATFTATPTGGGTSPTYQWKLNGANVGTGGITYTNTTLAHNDVVTCVMTSNLVCVTTSIVTSNSLTITVAASVTPAVSIAVGPSNTNCDGATVTFTASPTNGGTTPTYQWKLNGANVGTGGATYITTTLADNDVVSCEMTSSIICVTSTTATSNSITMTVNPNLVPSVTIIPNPNDTVCAGLVVGFFSTPVNGGVPFYQWKLNGVDVTGATSSTFNSGTLVTGDVVSVVMTSNLTCLTTTTATSPGVTMTVNPNLTPSVSIAVGPNDTICAGTATTFTATPTNGGATPAYQWKLNGINTGANSPIYLTSTLANADVVTCVMTSSELCVTAATGTSNAITMVVNPNLTPSVVIAPAPNDTVCAGTSVTFTATPTNGGTAPTYQWKLNGANVGTGGTTYTSATLVNNDAVTCEMTSNETCVTSASATSNTVTMAVNANLVPLVTISVSPSDTVCDGTMVTFSTISVHGGSAPTFQWKKNGTDIAGATNSTYSTNALVNNDAITVVMTSNEACLAVTTATSTAITMTINAKVVPSVSIAVAPNDTICAGTSTTFTATPTNGGTTPTYQWKVNGANVGTGGATYTSATLANSDVVSCVMTTSLTCVTTTTGTSNSITMTVNPNLIPSVVIAPSPNDTICAGTSTTFTATPTNGGTAPAYQWKLNGVNVGTGGTTYTTATLANGDVVTCVLTSSETCVTSATGTSNSITMTVNPNLIPLVTTTVSPNDTICDGTSVTFSTTIVNGGPTPTYQWKKNGTDIAGATNSTYNTTTLANNDAITVVMTSSETCLAVTSATSTAITMTVNPNLIPDVSISVAPNDTICDGVMANFTASPINAGLTPTYQWTLNGTNVGSNSLFYSNNALNAGDAVRVILTSSETCLVRPIDSSNTINMHVNPLTIPTVSIVSPIGTTICEGGTVNFVASFTNGGISRTYQWKNNGTNVAGATNSIYTTNTISNGDVITCEMTITALCPAPATVISNALTMTVLLPTVSIQVSPSDTICAGTSAVYNVTGTNLGPNPQYQWYLNNVMMIGVISDVFTIPAPADGDEITTIFTGSDNCVNAARNADTIKMSVTPVITPTVSIFVTPDSNISPGQYVIFNAVTNATNPGFQWRKNGTDVPGETNNTYVTGSIVDQDTITCFVTTPDSCATANNALSNKIKMSVAPVSVKHLSTQQLFDDITLAPNPNGGNFYIKGKLHTGLNDEVIKVEVINTLGAVVYRGSIKVERGEFKHHIDMGDIADGGLHMARLHLNNRVHYIKFITAR